MTNTVPPQPKSPLRRLTADTLVYGLGGSATRLISVIFVPIFTRIFTPSDYGILDLLTTLTSLLTLFAMVGMNSAVFFYYRRTEDSRERGRLVTTAFVIATGGGVVLALLGIALAEPLTSLLLQDTGYRLALVLTFVLLPVNIAASMVLDLLRLEFRRYAYTVLGVGRALFSSALGVALVLTTHAGIAGLIGAQAVLAGVAAVIGLVITRGAWLPAIQPAVAGRMLRFGLPFVPTGLSYWVLQYVDRYFVLSFRGTTELGLYAIANRLAALLMLLTYAFQTAWWPFAWAHAGQPGDRVLFARVFGIVSAGLLVASFLLSMFAREALLVLTTPAYLPAYPYVGLLALALVIQAVYQVVSIGVQIAERTGSMAVTSGVAAVVNIVLNFALIPPLGLWGASIATAVGYLVSTALLYRVAQRHFPVPYDLRAPIVVCAGAAAFVGAGLLLDELNGASGWSPLVSGAKVLLTALALVLVALYLRLSPGRLRQALAALRP